MKTRALLLGSCLLACATEAAPVSQAILYVDTDAPIAEPGAGSPNPAQSALVPPLALFDALRIEVFAPNAVTPCDKCTNDFAIDALGFRNRRVSVGIAYPTGTSGYRARVRLFVRRFASPTGEPDASSTIDSTVELPVLSTGTLVDRTVLLGTDNVGQPTGTLDAAAATTPGAPAKSLVGTWQPAQRATCDESLRKSDSQVCVPGGAYWMGSGQHDLLAGVTPGWHRLVTLSPFFVDPTEVTAKQYRLSGQPIKNPWTGGTSGSQPGDWCTLTPQPSERDGFPANCVALPDARAYCQSKGGDLPTEAQFEYLAGALVGLPYVWGADEPACSDTVFARNGFGLHQYQDPQTCLDAKTNAMGALGGPEMPGHGTRDMLSLADGTIVDLVGNVSEWVRDKYQDQTEPCWSPAGVLADPYCGVVGALGDSPATRGGSWAGGGSNMLSAARSYVVGGPRTISEEVGFRCVYPATK